MVDWSSEHLNEVNEVNILNGLTREIKDQSLKKRFNKWLYEGVVKIRRSKEYMTYQATDKVGTNKMA